MADGELKNEVKDETLTIKVRDQEGSEVRSAI